MRERDELEGMLHDAAGRLSAAHVAALVAHPEAVCSALAVAADALAARDRERSEVDRIAGPASTTVDADEAERRLAARTRTGAAEILLTSEELAARTGLRTRQSVHDWRRKGRIVGWQNARRGYVFPSAQLDERDRPLAGLDRVTALFADGHAAWVWLTTARPSLDGAEPLALLVRGEVERVAEAAQGDRQGDFA
ncbi:MAG: hypothetical protein OXH92_21915 [Bryobacterales bacterium]|nr:hypothetical protein [Bryobacterales bacterium]MDE0436661.1 hypothetical protein [Bryobacterales bacterium]